ncbi:uncharacterized protein IL334_000138 [Kwoniella shivajii]|uniref:Extracellular membrane protein CFEM domain-containing protein n=1 Tax=Kwoniella shivajii TaxID=564305 RepID=A0ABZ1CNA8_9TREE|nr:hypothetical protein IL334_000138 [Kwoniella shivajii]
MILSLIDRFETVIISLIIVIVTLSDPIYGYRVIPSSSVNIIPRQGPGTSAFSSPLTNTLSSISTTFTSDTPSTSVVNSIPTSINSKSATTDATNTTPSSSPTPALTLAMSLSTFAQNNDTHSASSANTEDQATTGNCTAQGGGCVIYTESLSSCEDDNCACDLSYSAQVCAQCLASQEAVQGYNYYLSACVGYGLVKPTETIIAQCEDATDTSDILTDMTTNPVSRPTPTETQSGGQVVDENGNDSSVNAIGNASGVEGDASHNISNGSGNENGSGGNPDSMGVVAIKIPDGTGGEKNYTSPEEITSLNNGYETPSMASNSPEGAMSTVLTTGMNGSPTSFVTSAGPTGNPTPSDADDVSTASLALGSSAEETASTDDTTTSNGGVDMNSQQSGTSALDSAKSFFSSSVDPTCQSNCDTWLESAQSCTDDTCICNSQAMDSAKACSSCVLSANSTDQMNAYASFDQGCVAASAEATEATSSSQSDLGGSAAEVSGQTALGMTTPIEPNSSGTSDSTVTGSKSKSTATGKKQNAETGMATATAYEDEESSAVRLGRGHLAKYGGVVVTILMGLLGTTLI